VGKLTEGWVSLHERGFVSRHFNKLINYRMGSK